MPDFAFGIPLMTERWPKPLKIAAVSAAALSAAIMLAALYVFEPSAGSFFPKCIFHQLTGLNCPGCGLQRAIHALMHGHVAEAVHYNAILPVLAFVAAAYGVAYALRNAFPRFHRAFTSARAAVLVLALIVAWWVLRNILRI